MPSWTVEVQLPNFEFKFKLVESQEINYIRILFNIWFFLVDVLFFNQFHDPYRFWVQTPHVCEFENNLTILVQPQFNADNRVIIVVTIAGNVRLVCCCRIIVVIRIIAITLLFNSTGEEHSRSFALSKTEHGLVGLNFVDFLYTRYRRALDCPWSDCSI